MHRILARLSIALGLACVLAACGGSSGSTGPVAGIPTPTPVTPATPPAPTAGIHCAPPPAAL
ncbi:hypothetical protein [Variovorax sp. GB1P17]|uniref:hypothetical protein n=1 Tax=Variovorax sp. GB1P17 TaxID=3443740 RepID=UPI003F482047